MVAVRLMEGLARVPVFTFELRLSTGRAFGSQRDVSQPFGDPHLRLIRPHSFQHTPAQKKTASWSMSAIGMLQQFSDCAPSSSAPLNGAPWGGCAAARITDDSDDAYIHGISQLGGRRVHTIHPANSSVWKNIFRLTCRNKDTPSIQS
jgi:hypothetical protein